MKILVFTEGTVLMHSSLQKLTRQQRVKKTKKRLRPLPNNFFKEEIPNGNAVEITTHYYDEDKKDLKSLKQFLENNL